MTSLLWGLYLYWLVIWLETSTAQELIGLPVLKPASLYGIPSLTTSWVHRGYHCQQAMFVSGNLCQQLLSYYHHYSSSSLKSCFLDKIHINNLTDFLKLIMIFNIITFCLYWSFFLFLGGSGKEKYRIWTANGSEHYIRQGWANFYVKSQIVNGFGFVGHTVSIPTTPLHYCSIKQS